MDLAKTKTRQRGSLLDASGRSADGAGREDEWTVWEAMVLLHKHSVSWYEYDFLW